MSGGVLHGSAAVHHQVDDAAGLLALVDMYVSSVTGDSGYLVQALQGANLQALS